MTEQNYTLAGIPVCVRYGYAKSQTETVCAQNPAVPVFSVTEDAVRAYPKIRTDENAAAAIETTLLQNRITAYLLKRNTAVFHAAAFLWRGRAWLLTAPSGTGKTTQYLHWKFLYKDAVTVINGDKPVLAMDEQRKIRVYPSPWCGKERLGNRFAAENSALAEAGIPLGGVILLEQGKENRITRETNGAILPLLAQFLAEWTTPAVLAGIAAMTDAILRSVPVYRLVNVGDAASAELTHDRILTDENGNV